MNKNILGLMMLLLMVLSVTLMSASAIEIDVDCDGPGWFNSDICRDHELEDEFEEVTDAINNIEGQTEETWVYIEENVGTWIVDNVGGGWSMRGVLRFLYGDYIDFLTTILQTKEEASDHRDLIYRLQAEINLMKEGNMDPTETQLRNEATMLKAKDTGETYIFPDGTICDPVFDKCIKIS